MSDKRGNILLRFGIIYTLIVALFLVGVLGTIIRLQTTHRKPYLKLAEIYKPDTVVVEQNRGNILACDGQLMAMSMPYYELSLDLTIQFFNDTIDNHQFDSTTVKRDTAYYKYLWFFTRKKIKETKKQNFELCINGLAEAFAKVLGDKSAQDYKREITTAFRAQNNNYRVSRKQISYVELQHLKAMPMYVPKFRKKTVIMNNKRTQVTDTVFVGNPYRSGLQVKEFPHRVQPFGSLAARTLGSLWATDQKSGEMKGSGQIGLEKFFDAQMTGKSGLAVRHKIAGKSGMEQTIVEPINGNDIVTTIDVDIQDMAEKYLRENAKKYEAREACAIIMTTDGEIKACVNLFRDTVTGRYRENNDMIFTRRYEIGSTFKTLSMMIALDNDFVSAGDTINTAISKYELTKQRGHPNKMTAAQVLAISDNIGISNIIVPHYEKNPGKFFDAIYDTHFLDSMDICIKEAIAPTISEKEASRLNGKYNISVQRPNSKGKLINPSVNTDKTAKHIARITFGQSIAVPPIYILRFYNAIANGGKMVEPCLTKSVKKDKHITKTFKKHTVTTSICSNSALETLQKMLEGVMTDTLGTGRRLVKSKYFKIAGKTGTADIDNSTKNYSSFCGYFPADNPKYTCLVAMVVRGGKHGYYGAEVSGTAFKSIAEGVMAMETITPAFFATDSTRFTQRTPKTKNGNYKYLQTVLNTLHQTMKGTGNEWVSTRIKEGQTAVAPLETAPQKLPDLHGMPARDAVYLAEKAGYRVKIDGKGKVTETQINGKIIILKLN